MRFRKKQIKNNLNTMKTSAEIRQAFLDFFASKGHKIVPSAPLVSKSDPTLMFTNSGMAPFKDFFLGNKPVVNPRVADTQKCLRVSGKHNDLEDVGYDGTHHTMFEMLGNWSFGDYFTTEAIAWAWELLTEVYKIDGNRLYASYFGGDENENLAPDNEARDLWLKYLPTERVLPGNKKDNFWEMGDTGPCGPCSEIHIDLRPDAERAKVDGATLVNADDPLVIEIWNNVFMQFERRADKSLVPLPAKHVDTGMGFERLCMVLQGVDKTYDTDVFRPMIQFIENFTNIAYKGSFERSAKTDIAMRISADHIRAVAFVIADGQLPSNTGAGYVIRRILRRAVRYNFQFLGIKESFLYKLVPLLAENLKTAFPELKAQEAFVAKVVMEEENSFLRTLEQGLKRIETMTIQNNTLDGVSAFELLDTYGFPIDLTRLIMAERNIEVDEKGFEKALEEQKARSRKATARQVGDWSVLIDSDNVNFVGYDQHQVADAQVTKYRTITEKGKTLYQICLDTTPFYPEGGGQVGDTGTLLFGSSELVNVLDTKKENDLVIHFVDKLPEAIDAPVLATIDTALRLLTENNHSVTHLVHAALRQVLGTHVQQKGSFNNHKTMRFDFSHFAKVTDEELTRVEDIVNAKIRQAIPLTEYRNISIEEAQKAGAMMLFGEKYGETVRMIVFDPEFSMELCGGTHVKNTAQIGLFKFVTETSVAAGVRRVEAITAEAAQAYIQQELSELEAARGLFKGTKDLAASIQSLQDDNRQLRKQLEQLYVLQAKIAKQQILQNGKAQNGLTYYGHVIEIGSAEALKTLASDLRKDLEKSVIGLGAIIDGKPQLVVAITDDALATNSELNAGKLVKSMATHIKGGGGGQPFLATAGGQNAEGLVAAVQAVLD